MWTLEFGSDWIYWYSKLDRSLAIIALKRMSDMKKGERQYQHLKYGSPFFKDEFEHQNFKICFLEDEEKKIRTLYFVGDHKNYDKWLGYGGC